MLKRHSLAAVLSSITLLGGSASFTHADDETPVRVASIPATITPDASPAIVESKASLGLDTSQVVEFYGLEAREFQIATLKSMVETLDQIPSYSAEMTKQERIGGDVGREQKIDLKFRHADEAAGISQSIYMKWQTGDRGREVIYVDGLNNGKMLVHAGGWKARILPVLSLDPNGAIAMSEARHPINEAGLKHLTSKWLRVRLGDEGQAGIQYHVEPADFDGRNGYKFSVTYSDKSQNGDYRKCELWIDSERNIPLASVNYTWSVETATDAQTMVERYEYRNVELNANLSDADFDRTNRRYAFKK